jgi:dGTPase
MPTLESQTVDLADEVAYNCADLDDALKMAYIEEEDLKEIPWVFELFERSRAEAGVTAREKYIRFRAIGNLYDAHVDDILTTTSLLLEESGVATVDEVRDHKGRLADFSEGFKARLDQLKNFLLDRVYHHPKTVSNSERGKKFIRELFCVYLENPKLLPFKYQKKIEAEGRHRVVCDYLSGMTDRFLHEQYRALFHPEMLH